MPVTRRQIIILKLIYALAKSNTCKYYMVFRKQQKYQTNAMNSLSLVVPLFELVLSSLRTYRFLFQAFFWKKFRPGCVWLAAVEQDAETGELQYKAFQETFR